MPGAHPSSWLRTWASGEIRRPWSSLCSGPSGVPMTLAPRAGPRGTCGQLLAGRPEASFSALAHPTGCPCRYLKEFRTEQCPLFVQHKCTQHRPYTCFHWHFVNQRRRRSIRRRDGTFNYSPDVYCTKYDEATGLCPEGDE